MTKRRDTDDELPRLYCPDEVARAIRCSEWWVKEQARRRRIPFVRSGGAYRFTKDHVDEIIRLLEERPESGAGTGRRTPRSGSPGRVRRMTASTTAPAELRARTPRRARKAA